MKALTLHRPWPYAIFWLGKDIENRGWKCPLPVGEDFAIHAGKGWDQDGAEWMERQGMALPPLHKMGVIGVVRFEGNLDISDSRWHYKGLVGWKLGNPRPLTVPIECRGQQGLWELPPDIARRVQDKLDLRPQECPICGRVVEIPGIQPKCYEHGWIPADHPKLAR